MSLTNALRVGRIGGIPIEVHPTFSLILIWGGWQGYEAYQTGLGALLGILAVVLLFGCVLLHELAHGVQARAFGLSVRRVLLLPIGGLLELETPPAHPWQELVVTLAGPLTNLGLAFLFGIAAFSLTPAVWVNWRQQFQVIPVPSLTGMFAYLAYMNLSLFLFNILPVFPMDGGRILRAGLAMITSYVSATRIAAWLGRLLAIGLGVIGLFGLPPIGLPPDPLLLVIALVVYLGARSEELFVRRRWALARVEVRDVIQNPPWTLAPWDPITRSLVAALFESDHIVPVTVENRLVGLLTYEEARRFAGRPQTMTVAHAMRTTFPVLQLHDTLWVALREMMFIRLSALPVTEGNDFRGMVGFNDINDAWRHVA